MKRGGCMEVDDGCNSGRQVHLGKWVYAVRWMYEERGGCMKGGGCTSMRPVG
jgi:hypothetical protein